MAKIAARAVNIAIGAVAIEDAVDNFTLEIPQEIPVTTAFADAGPRRVVANYDYSLDVQGAADFASGKIDATLFALIGDADGASMAVDPTGASAGPNDPNYDGSVVLESMRISGAVGGRVDIQGTMRGNAALARTVA